MEHIALCMRHCEQEVRSLATDRITSNADISAEITAGNPPCRVVREIFDHVFRPHCSFCSDIELINNMKPNASMNKYMNDRAEA